jgi:hypothetical protein
MNADRAARAQLSVNQVAPGLAFRWSHTLPALSVYEKLLALFNAEAGEFIERFKALGSLIRG